MRLERSFRLYSPEIPSFEVHEPVKNITEFEPFVAREVILFSRIDEGDVETPNHDQAPEIDRAADQIKTKPNGDWEPIGNEPVRDRSFLNFYGGPFAERMEIHRPNIERFLNIAGIEGKVTFTDATLEKKKRRSYRNARRMESRI